MQELPLAIQLKLKKMPGAETGTQTVELILEDGRVVPDVEVRDCAIVADDSFDAELVADVRLPAAPPSPRSAVIFLLLLLAGIFVMYYLLRAFKPE
jgi:hypothetical protein